MVIRESISRAWLLSKYIEDEPIEVIEHPVETCEVERIAHLISDYGNSVEKKTANNYLKTKDTNLVDRLIDIYHRNWCQVREWNNLDEQILYFRICSSNFNWYQTIMNFLSLHPHKSYKISVSNKLTNKKYWDGVTYDYAINPENETILESLLRTE